MIKKALFSVILLSCFFNGFSQFNVKAWYADGQVFVVWKFLVAEETYAIYASPTSFTNTDEAFLVGRPFALEYTGFELKDNLEDTTLHYKIPDGQDSIYQLTSNEGLFVYTPHQSDSLYFAVTKWGDNTVTPGQNITDTAVPFTYDPVNDPVECHLQHIFTPPLSQDHVSFAYCMWADGRQNHWEGRPDFPITANAAKNGMPGLFLVSVPIGIDTSMAFPLSVWLHGGGGRARQSLAGFRKEIHINPATGILVAHNDRMHGYRGATPPNSDQPSWHFGWAKNYNPFILTPLTADTIINFTQRRYLWIDSWLAKHFNIDTLRINIHGHSMGSAGALAMAKSFPDHYGSATIFNTGCVGPRDSTSTTYLFGTAAENYPTNLKNQNNEPVRFFDLWDLYTNCSPQRDLPLIKHWHGKNDINDAMGWSPLVVKNYRICDSIGTGIQNYWSEREHGVGTGPINNDHWVMGTPLTQQTSHDNVDFAEIHHRSNLSFPAFFNHRLDNSNNDPGSGLNGINNGDGDNWGTWGGYHRWANVLETPQVWRITAWLEDNAIFTNENAVQNSLSADLAIRKPQVFTPATGELVHWTVKDFSSGTILQSGSVTVTTNNLLLIPQVVVFKENIRKVIITVSTSPTSIAEISTALQLAPNPTTGIIFTAQDWAEVNIIDINGRVINRFKIQPASQILDLSHLPAGLYFLDIKTIDEKRILGKLVKL